MSSPEKKTNMSLLLSLPDELLLICVARVSRLYYPAISLVSKRFRSLIASPDLDKTRSLLGITDSCLYVYLNINYTYRMFTLSWKPDKTVTDDTKKSSGYVLATVPSPHSNGKIPCRVVAVGSNVYNIKESSPSCSVSILNCRSHTWHEAPVLQENLSLLLYASVVDQKICVTGTSFDVYGLKNDIAVFDTKTQSWDPMPIPCRETQGRKYRSNAYIDGKLHLLTDRGLIAYNSQEGRWDNTEIGDETWNRMYYPPSCHEIDKVMYYLSHGEFTWHDTEVNMWRDLKGLVGLPELPYGVGVRYVDYGGKMMVLWEEDGPCYEPGIIKEKMIWCAEITLEKRENREIWGIVEWFEHVLTVPYRCRVMDVVVATV